MAIAGRMRAALVGMSLLAIAGCQDADGIISLFPKADAPIPPHLVKKMKEKGMTAAAPIMIRIFKEEDTLEVWKATHTGRYELLESYEICRWSGKLGPKFKEGDRQAPEGFYTVNPYQMNPKSSYYLSFNMGFPNAFDRAHERTGTHLMVHGACSSAGCYSMTDERIAEIYALARESFKGGQESFQIQAYPFRMTPENMARHRDSPHFEFWQMLKEGSDHFEITRYPPKVDVCDKRYVFNRVVEDEKAALKPTEPCPEMTMPDSLALAYSEKVSKDEKAFEEVLKKIAIRDLLAGRKPPRAVERAATVAADPGAGEVTPAASAVPADGDVPVAAADGVPVPVPSPIAAAAAPVEQPRRNWLQRLFASKQ